MPSQPSQPSQPSPDQPARRRVVVAGEALVDLAPARTDDGADALVPVPGGAPLNVATAAARLGADVAWTGPLGDDGFGALLRGQLASEGIATDLVVDVAAPTTLAVVHLDDQARASYAFYLDGTTLRHRDADVPDLADGEVLVVCCGAVGLVDAPYGDALAEAVRREAGARPVWLDPNVRPSAVPDRGTYLRLLDELVAGCTLVKASDDDLAWLVEGGRAEAEQLARRWAAVGPAVVVVTLGADGALALRDGRPDVRVDGVAVDVVDTIGAGDTVTGALVAGLQAHDALTGDRLAALDDAVLGEVLRTAVTAAAVTCTRRGADPPTRADVDAASA